MSLFKRPAILPGSITKNAVYLNAIRYTFIFLPAIVYFFIACKYTVNVPIWDDYNVILHFISTWKNAHGLEKITMLFALENEHRIVVSKIVYVLYYDIFGNINFANLVFLGNIQLLLSFILFIAFIKKCLPHHWVIASFVLSLCMFDLNTWQNADFASSCMANYGIILFFAAGLYCYSRDGKKFLIPGIIFQVLCTFTYGNGIIASGFLLLFNLLNGNRIKSVYSALTFVIFSSLYFYHYASPAAHPLLSKFRMIRYFFHFIIAFIEEGSFTLPLIAGILMLICLIATFPLNKKMRIKREALPIVCLLGFVLLSMIPASIFRSNVIEYIPSRYRFYSNLVPAILFLFLLMRLKDNKFKTPVAAIYTILILLAYSRDFSSGQERFSHLRDVLTTVDFYYPEKDVAKRISIEACQQKIYCIDDHRKAQIIY